MNDQILQGLAFGNEVRFLAAYTKETVNKAQQIHHTYPVCTAALGRLLTGAAMMGAMCKNEEDLITLKIDGDGPIRQAAVTADAHGNVKGLLYDPAVELPLKANGHLDVGTAIGHGTLCVIKDLGLKEPYVGQTSLVSGEIGEDLTYYFASSEQVPTSVGLGVLVDTDLSVKHAGGFIIQLLPFASEDTISALEQALGKVRSVTDYFVQGKTPEEMMRDILGEIEIEAVRPVQYHCNCDRERVTKALISLGRKELDEMIADDRPVTLHCDFCNKDYTFSVDELKALL
ncbi:MAG: Hsp33 family molecular chaperone HslO [Lachnospiraceae bacterium]|nr:Hsp33 family molecular chaperone HslO [Lachnospiraceae bacterium]MBP3296336.1 Hsp33 family molecular chaperone HslO [Lachnospiraceae bacterium]